MPVFEEPILTLGETTFRRSFQRFGMRQADRLSHLYIVGKTGVGKSTLLEQLAHQDLDAGSGFALIDPHGDLVERIATTVRPSDSRRVRYLNAADPHQPYGYNPVRRVREDRIPLAASGLMDTLKKLWPDAWGVRMEHVLRNSLYVLLEREGSTLLDLLRLYADKAFRKDITTRIRNPVVRRFWHAEFAHYPDRYRLEVVAPIQNKLGALLSDPTLYRILVRPKVDLRLRSIMDEGGVLLVNLSKGQLGEDSAATLGGLLVSTLGLAALSRADMPEESRRPFFAYVDEFQSFTTLAFASMLAEVRKYGLGLTLAHQYLAQLEPDVRNAVIANTGSVLSFRVGPQDAEHLAREFEPTFGAQDLLTLPNRHFYLKLLIDRAPTRPFSARTPPADSFIGRSRR